jgi:hypothetical protein
MYYAELESEAELATLFLNHDIVDSHALIALLRQVLYSERPQEELNDGPAGCAYGTVCELFAAIDTSWPLFSRCFLWPDPITITLGAF